MFLLNFASDLPKIRFPTQAPTPHNSSNDEPENHQRGDRERRGPTGKASQRKQNGGNGGDAKPSTDQAKGKFKLSVTLSHRLEVMPQVRLDHTVAPAVARRETYPATQVSNINTTNAATINHFHSFCRASNSRF